MTSSEFNREQGAVMVLALGFTMIVGTLLVGAITTTTLLSRSTRSNLDSTVAQGLAEVPFMQDVEHWGVLTIGTGLGNARFTNRRNGKKNARSGQPEGASRRRTRRRRRTASAGAGA